MIGYLIFLIATAVLGIVFFGVDGAAWAIVGFFVVTAVSIPIWVILKYTARRCSECREEIKYSALRCKHCGADFRKGTPQRAA
jgi:uncharacterized membrane protein